MMKEKDFSKTAAEKIIADVKAHMAGGEKPAWAGREMYVGKQAVEDWENFEKSKVPVSFLNSFGKLVAENQDLINAIATLSPGSVKELADTIDRAESNVSRTLKKLVGIGVVAMQDVEGSSAKRPILAMRTIRFDFNIVDQSIAVLSKGVSIGK